MNAAGDLFRDACGSPRDHAQTALWGRSHYCDDSTLRFHKSRITHSETVHDGQYLLIVEAYAVDYRNTRRAFRGVIFSTDGTIAYRPTLEGGYSSTAIALKHARLALATLPIHSHTQGSTP